MMAKSKRTTKKAAKPAKPTVSLIIDETDTFEIETEPPPPLRGASIEKLKMLAKLDRTLENVSIGEAFIIPSKHKFVIQRHLSRVYPMDKFAYTRILGNPDMIRVYRKAHTKNK